MKQGEELSSHHRESAAHRRFVQLAAMRAKHRSLPEKTLLEALAVSYGLNAEGGSRNFNFGTRESHSELHRNIRMAKGHRRPRDAYFLRAESFFNVATEIEKLDAEPANVPPIGPAYGRRPLHEQSHGESFLALLTKKFRGQGLYFLDEPEAALSPNDKWRHSSRSMSW